MSKVQVKGLAGAPNLTLACLAAAYGDSNSVPNQQQGIESSAFCCLIDAGARIIMPGIWAVIEELPPPFGANEVHVIKDGRVAFSYCRHLSKIDNGPAAVGTCLSEHHCGLPVHPRGGQTGLQYTLSSMTMRDSACAPLNWLKSTACAAVNSRHAIFST